MASYTIKANNAPYYDLEVTFADQVFRQTVIFNEEGESLSAALQAYADQYEAEWTEAGKAK